MPENTAQTPKQGIKSSFYWGEIPAQQLIKSRDQLPIIVGDQRNLSEELPKKISWLVPDLLHVPEIDTPLESRFYGSLLTIAATIDKNGKVIDLINFFSNLLAPDRKTYNSQVTKLKFCILWLHKLKRAERNGGTDHPELMLTIREHLTSILVLHLNYEGLSLDRSVLVADAIIMALCDTPIPQLQAKVISDSVKVLLSLTTKEFEELNPVLQSSIASNLSWHAYCQQVTTGEDVAISPQTEAAADYLSKLVGKLESLETPSQALKVVNNCAYAVNNFILLGESAEEFSTIRRLLVQKLHQLHGSNYTKILEVINGLDKELIDRMGNNKYSWLSISSEFKPKSTSANTATTAAAG